MKIVPLIIIITNLISFSCHEEPTGPVRRTLSGHITAVGNAPFVKLALRDREGGTYEIASDEREKLKALQGTFVTVTADVHTLTMKTADGKYTRTVRVLRNVTIIPR